MTRVFRAGLWAECATALALGVGALALLDAGPVGLLIGAAAIAGPVALLSPARNFAEAYLRLALPAVAGLFLFSLYFWAHETPALHPYIAGRFDDFDQYVGEQYYAVMSTLFAIITALILVKGMESFDRLNAVIVEEANQVRSIFEFLYYFEELESGPTRDNVDALRRTAAIRTRLKAYCDAAAEDPAARRADGANAVLRDTTKIVGGLSCADDNDRMALAEVMRGLNQLFAIRARRVACSRARVPFYMILTLGVMSLAIISPFVIGAPETHPFNAWIIFVLTTFCAFILMLLRDINAPFDGFWRVDLGALDEMRRDIATRIAEDRALDLFDNHVSRTDIFADDGRRGASLSAVARATGEADARDAPRA